MRSHGLRAQHVFCRRLHRQVGEFLTPDNAIDIAHRAAIHSETCLFDILNAATRADQQLGRSALALHQRTLA